MAEPWQILVPNPGSQLQNSLCTTCLAADRDLYSLQRVPQLLDVCNGYKMMYSDKVCWECLALLKKMWNFRIKAYKAKMYFLQISKYKQPSNQGLFTRPKLSNLGCKHTSTFDCEYTEPAFDDIEIKMEEDNGLHEEIILPTDYGTDLKDELRESNPLNEEFESTQTEQIDTYNDDISEDFDYGETKTKENEKSDNGVVIKILDEESLKTIRDVKLTCRWYKQAQYKCVTCIEFFNTAEAYNFHTEKHSEESGSYICNLCEQRFRNSTSLNDHRRKHYVYYGCEYCSFTHTNKTNLMSHLNRKHSDKVRICKACDATFTTPGSLSYHCQVTHKEHPKCELCSKKFKTLLGYKRHMSSQHSKVPMDECPICKKKYKGSLGLKCHMKTHENTCSEEAYCAECGVQYKSVHNYRAHLKNSLRHVEGNESTKASTTEVQTITSRKRKKTNAQRCREYRERKKLQNIIVQNITAERSDQCSETDQLPAKKPKTDAERRKKYYEAQKLKKQKIKKIPKTAKQRNKEYYYRKKKFQALNTLNHHSDVYQCNECSKKFPNKSYIRRHIIRSHMKLKTYKCVECDKVYDGEHRYRRHMLSSHGPAATKKDFVCHICGKGFATKRLLEPHVNSHLGERPYKCKICEATFCYSAALYNHNRLVHLKLKRNLKKKARVNESQAS